MIVLRQTNKIIGRGGHWDKIAQEAIDRKEVHNNNNLFVAECGLGASGFPHIGSFADATRAYVVRTAVMDTGSYDTTFYAYSDDLDGLRKVPHGLPDKLNEWIGVPVSNIPDPFECHNSYGYHMVSLLLESLDEANIEYQHQSAKVLYESGTFSDQIHKILSNYQQVGEIIHEITGQKKYLSRLPYHPICGNCGKIYTTMPIEFDPVRSLVSYRCQNATISGKVIEGCLYNGQVHANKSNGKLSWKVEFAARWSALGVDFEPFGKDIHESVLTNNDISRSILGYEPPHQIKYEMFLDKGGTKISKSKGNVFTPQKWFSFASPQSLVLMTLKRVEGARSLGIEDIPNYMDELHELEALYFGLTHDSDQNRRKQSKALYEYSWWLTPPDRHSLVADKKRQYKHISYSLVSHLARFNPGVMSLKEFIRYQLEDYEMIQSDQDWQNICSWVDYPIRWSIETNTDKQQPIQVSADEILALRGLILKFESIEFDPDNIQQAVFTCAKENNIKTRRFFMLLYQIFLGVNYGPRIGKIIDLMGREMAITKVKQVAGST